MSASFSVGFWRESLGEIRNSSRETRGGRMQNGSLVCRQRHQGACTWEFRWREPGSVGKRRNRRIVLGSTLELSDECATQQAIAALRLAINGDDERVKNKSRTIADAFSHYRQQELRAESAGGHSQPGTATRGTSQKWVITRWGTRTLASIKAGEVELWMRSLRM